MDLPDLPEEFQLEVRYKLAFIFSKIDQTSLSKKVILSIIDNFIDSDVRQESFLQLKVIGLLVVYFYCVTILMPIKKRMSAKKYIV